MMCQHNFRGSMYYRPALATGQDLGRPEHHAEARKPLRFRSCGGFAGRRSRHRNTARFHLYHGPCGCGGAAYIRPAKRPVRRRNRPAQRRCGHRVLIGILHRKFEDTEAEVFLNAGSITSPAKARRFNCLNEQLLSLLFHGH